MTLAEVYSCGTVRQRISSGAQIRRHCHPDAYAALVLAGSYSEAGNHGRFAAQAGAVLLHGRFDCHTNNLGRRGAEVFNLPLRHPVSFAFGVLPDADAIVRLAARDLVAAEAALFAAMQPLVPPDEDWVDHLRRALDANPDISLAGWAGRHGVRPETLSRRFRAAYGISPASYRAEARARHALHGLQKTTLPLAQLAATCGFCDQAHMTRAVRALSGAPPSFWRSGLLGARIVRSNTFKTDGALSDKTPA